MRKIPLDGIGVLEFVDKGNLPTATQAIEQPAALRFLHCLFDEASRSSKSIRCGPFAAGRPLNPCQQVMPAVYGPRGLEFL